MPVPAVEWVDVVETADGIEASYRRPVGLEDAVEISTDLQSWATTVLDKITISPMGDLEVVTLHIPREEKTQYVRIIVK